MERISPYDDCIYRIDRESFLQNEIIGQHPEIDLVYYRQFYKHNCCKIAIWKIYIL